MVRGKDVEVKILVDTDEFSAALGKGSQRLLERVRYTMSPFYSALRQISMAVEAHIKAGGRVGANKRTVAVVMAAERLYEIDEGNRDGTLDLLGYPIVDEEE